MDEKYIAALLSELDLLPIDRRSILQGRLDLVNRKRTSLFPWRGQFSPEFIEVMLTEYARSDSVVADPFVGSGTTLFEAARRTLSCFGAEINPAAVVMASTVQFVNLDILERKEYLNTAQAIIEKHLPFSYLGSLFSLLERREGGKEPLLKETLRAVLQEASAEALVHNIIANTVIGFMASKEKKELGGLFRAFKEHQTIIEQLPCSASLCKVFHCDARSLPIESGSVDLVVTSPPYINVLNYHQNYRAATELMDWDILRIARSEIGSNRKNRGNRFLTVVQYSIDMLEALLEMRRIICPDGRIIIVVGRESKVRGISFQNGRIIAALAIGGANFHLDFRQERKFKTRFGDVIYEDILHLVPSVQAPLPLDNLARSLAQFILNEVIDQAAGEVRDDILLAIQEASMVRPSPHFRHQARVKGDLWRQLLTLTS